MFFYQEVLVSLFQKEYYFWLFKTKTLKLPFQNLLDLQQKIT